MDTVKIQSQPQNKSSLVNHSEYLCDASAYCKVEHLLKHEILAN